MRFVIAATAASIATAVGLAGPAGAQGTTAPPGQPALKPAVVATFLNNAGDKIGTATLTGGENRTVVRIAIDAKGLPPGWHGLHFHAVGDCSDHEKFEASKAHVNPDGRQHGLLNANGPDSGDLPNLYVAADGSANAEVSSDTPLDGRTGLRDADGSAILVHANADDHSSQPIGGAGARVACAVIK